MGMVMALRRLAPVEAAQIVEDPDLVPDLIYGRDDEPIDKAEFRGPPDKIRLLDLNKSWHIIHFLLTGTDYDGEPPANALMDGAIVGEKEVGYQVPMLLSAGQVKAFADHLVSLGKETLMGRWDVDRMLEKEVYMAEIAQRDGDEMVDYVMEYFDELRIFARAAADSGEQILVVIT